jgi:hypothetical protein
MAVAMGEGREGFAADVVTSSGLAECVGSGRRPSAGNGATSPLEA